MGHSQTYRNVMPSFQITETLLLRTLTANDAPALFRSVEDNREYLREWLPWLDVSLDEEDSAEFIARISDQQRNNMGFQCGMFWNGNFVGMCGYHPIDRSNNSVVIGYWLAESMTGRGIVTRCVEFLTTYAFDNLNINKVCIPVAEGNAASRAVPERLNFVNEGIERAAEFLYCRYVNHVRYSVMQDEWRARNPTADA